MTSSTYQVKAPGKLMVAGEYAITEPGQDAIVVAVDRYITIQIKPSLKNQLDLPQLALTNVTWGTKTDAIAFSIEDDRLRFTKSVMEIVTAYLEHDQRECAKVHITVTSELDDPSGIKYGLGSSAAIVVALVTALIKFHQKTTPDRLVIFKLAALAHVKTQGNGSCADIAASTFGGWLNYRTFDGAWLDTQLLEKQSVQKLVNRTWPGLKIEPIEPPTVLFFLVGWTGESASTAPMVRRIHQLKTTNPLVYRDFLNKSQSAVEQILAGLATNDSVAVMTGVDANRGALRFLGEQANVEIETAALERFITLTAPYGSGKSSGAGGGDCGIAFVNQQEKVAALRKDWHQVGIVPLDLQISKQGVTIT